ncbi:MAG: hypothetical protein LUH56_00165 [Oscillospiraceae bacterium]|nr:hypothetical protein [Oscillospiraceae bacterium]MCD7824091.1 hypothetical protein [Oscillospiraceae bacterium]MCD7848232.1 hypothetical protein [Oscillospiraceae bacterium]
MKKVLSILLAMVLVLTVLCSFSFAAEAPENENDEVMIATTYCPLCGNIATTTNVTTKTYTYCGCGCNGVTSVTVEVNSVTSCTKCNFSNKEPVSSEKYDYNCGCCE